MNKHFYNVQLNPCKTDSQKDHKLIFKTNYRLMQVKSNAEVPRGSKGYFRPSLSYHLLLRPLFCLFLSGRFTQVLPYLFEAVKALARQCGY